MGDDEFDTPYTLHNHDALEMREYLRSRYGDQLDSVDTIITSPPYADLIDYGDQNGQIGKQGYEGFLDDIREVFAQCYELASESATLWIITDTYRLDGRLVRLPFDIADELENLPQLSVCQSDGCDGRLERLRDTGTLYCPECEATYDPLADSWRLTDHIIWDKQRTRPWRQKGQLRNVYEHVSMYTRSPEYTYDVDAIRITDTDEFARWWVDYPERYHPDGMVPGNVWEYPIPKQGQWGPKENFHPSPYPAELVERILQLTTEPEDVVLDPFAGIGTTLAVAEGLDRRPIGFELNAEFVDYYREHTRPSALERYSHVQETLTDSGAERRRTIWTLRIHKYALELARLLIGRRAPKGEQAETLDLPWLADDDLEFVVASVDPAALEEKGLKQPTVRLDYVHSAPGKLPLDSDGRQTGDDGATEDIEELQEALRSADPGSGDYYDIDVQIRFWEAIEFDSETFEAVVESSGSPAELYVYVAAVHHRYSESLSATECASLIDDDRIRRYRSRGYPPLLSTLPVDVDNPLGESANVDEGRQMDIGWFADEEGD